MIPILGAILVFVGSPHGLGITNDSARYHRIARVFTGEERLGKAYPEWMRHFPPGYPATLAAGRFVGLSKLTTGRWINAIAIAITTLLVGFTVFRLCDCTLWPALIASLLVVVSHVSLTMHLHLWSEPAFQVFLLLTIALLARQVERPTRRLALVIALVVASSTMVRYSGASLIIMGALTLFFVQRSSWKHRFIDSANFSLVAVAPLLILAAYNHTRAGDAVDRTIQRYGLHRVQIREAWLTFATWIFPEDRMHQTDRNWALLALILVFGGVVISRMWIRHRARQQGGYDRPPFPTYVRLALMMCVVYLAFLFTSLAFVDPATPLDDRILSPIYLLAIIIGMYGVHRSLTLTGAMTAPMIGKIATVLMLIVFTISTTMRGYDIFQYSRQQGFGYVNVRWRESELMRMIRAIPANTLVYTNVPDAVYFYTTNQARLIPLTNRKLSPKQLKQQRELIKQTQRRIRSEGAIIALFYGTADTRFRRGSQTIEEVKQVLDARLYKRCQDGVLMIPERATAKVKKLVARARRTVFPDPATQPASVPATLTTQPSR